jgi:hypothetical protein
MPLLYHLSPDYFTEFSSNRSGSLFGSTSNRIGEPGMYFAPNIGAAFKWVGTIAFRKGHLSKNKSKKQQRVNKEYDNDERDSPIPFPPKEQSMYKILYLYTVEISHDTMRKIKEHNRDWNKLNGEAEWDQRRQPIGAWEAEVFVPQEYLHELKIVGTKKYGTYELLDHYDRQKNQPRSEGYMSSLYESWPEKKPQPISEEEFNKVYEARKKFDSLYSPGDKILWNGLINTIEGVRGRFVLFGNWKGKKVDIIEFLEKAKPAPEEENKESKSQNWYGARRRVGILRLS